MKNRSAKEGEVKKADRKRVKACPACKGRMVPVVLGLPSPELFHAAKRGEIVLGGCCIWGDGRDPKWARRACGAMVPQPPDPYVDELAGILHALEAVDVSPFQRRARMLQSIWRGTRVRVWRSPSRRQGQAFGFSPRDALGSTIPGELFDTPDSGCLRAEVCDPKNSRGKLFGKPRTFSDLLSSQPLCFNLFAELQSDLPLASGVVAELTRGRFVEVLSIAFEHSPGRSDPRYTADRSAFDVFLECRTGKGRRGFIGIEVKFHENLLNSPGEHRARYDEIAAQMGCFKSEAVAAFRHRYNRFGATTCCAV